MVTKIPTVSLQKKNVKIKFHKKSLILCLLSVIAGTGCNAAFVEHISEIDKWTGDDKDPQHVSISLNKSQDGGLFVCGNQSKMTQIFNAFLENVERRKQHLTVSKRIFIF